MIKPQIRLFDKNFAHAVSCSNGDLKIYPKHFVWYRGNESRSVTVFVDGEGSRAPFVDSDMKVWMLLEPPTIVPHLYKAATLKSVQDMFDYILTFDKTLCTLSPKFVYYPLGGCWIEESQRKIYPKTKDISIIASAKNFTLGHKLRHQIIKQTSVGVDVYGRGYNPVESKLTALKDYRYTIVVENCKLDNYFSEKLIDALTVGTIPIYYGSAAITQTFNKNGILQIDNIADYERVVSTIHAVGAEQTYASALQAVQTNFETAKQYTNTEDWLWENFFKYHVQQS